MSTYTAFLNFVSSSCTIDFQLFQQFFLNQHFSENTYCIIMHLSKCQEKIIVVGQENIFAKGSRITA